MKNKKYLNTFLASTMATSMFVPTVLAATSTNTFTDIDASYAKDNINYLASKGIVNGTGGTLFSPYDGMTREQFAVILAKSMQYQKSLTVDTTATSKFTDVDSWAQPYVAALANKGLVGGYSQTSFGAKDIITREQMAVFYVRALGFDQQAQALDLNSVFTDTSKVSNYALKDVIFANKIGLISGLPDGSFNPQGQASRQDVAAMSYRFIDPTNTDNGQPNQFITAANTLIKGTTSDPGTTQPPVAALTISGVKLASSTTFDVTLSRPLQTGESLGFNFNGTSIPTSNVSVNGTDAVVTVPAMVDGTNYTLTIYDKDNTQIYQAVGQYVNKVPSAITTQPMGYALQVGNNIDVQYTVLDQNGQPLPGANVRIQVWSYPYLNYSGHPTLKEVNVVSDASGNVDYKYTSLDASSDVINAIATDAPATVRNEGNITIDWSYAQAGLITVDQPKDTTLGNGTMRQYIATFKDDKGNPLPKGTKVFVDLGMAYTSNVALDDVNGDFQKVDGASGDSEYAQAIIKGYDGTAKLLVTDLKNKESIKPMFFYDIDAKTAATASTASYIPNPYDPRVQAGATTYVTQIPTLTFDDTKEATVKVGDKRTVKLTAKDQFGNDYLGNVVVGLKEAMDNLNSTKYGSITYDVDVDRNGTIDGGAVESKDQTGAHNINFASQIAAGKLTTGSVNLVVKGGVDKDSATLVAFVDNNNDGIYNAGDTSQEVKTDFATKKISEISVNAMKGTTAAEGTDLDFEVTFKDQYGQPMNYDSSEASKLDFQVLDAGGNVVSDITKASDSVKFETDATAYEKNPTDGTLFSDGTLSGPKTTMVYKETTAGGQAKYVVRFNSNKAGTYTLRAFLDQEVSGPGTNDLKTQDDEVKKDTLITINGPVLTSGKITTVSPYLTAINTTSQGFTYQILNQDGKPYVSKPGSGDLTALFTFTNTSDKNVNVTDQIGNTIVLGPNETSTLIRTIVEGTSTYGFSVAPQEASSVTVTVQAQIQNSPATMANLTLGWVKQDVDSSATPGASYNGRVIAMSKDADASGKFTGTGWYMLQTPVGDVLVNFNTADATQVFTVDKNTDTQGKSFVEQLSIGDIVTWTDNTTDGKKHNDLTNN